MFQPRASDAARRLPLWFPVILAGIFSGFASGFPAGAPVSPAIAQEAADSAKPPAATPTPPPAAPSEWERLIYVPYRNLKKVFENERSAVLMPYSRFLKIWNRLSLTDLSHPPKPPVAAVITSAGYSGRIEKDLARVDVELTIQALGTPWAQLPIQFGEAAIGKMTASDDKILLQGTGNGTYTLLIPTPGEHKVRLELAARVRTSPDGRGLELDCPPAGVTTLDLTVPAVDQTIDLSPQGVVTGAEGEAGTTRVKAILGATKKISARWRPRVGAAPAMDVLTAVRNTLDVRIADGLVHTHATLTYDVLRGQLDQVRIGVPLDHRILDVTAAGLKSWKAAQEEKAQVVTVDLLGGESKSIVVEVHTERPAPEMAFAPAGVDDSGAYHGVHAFGEVREKGVLIISQGPDLSLAAQQQSGLARIDASEISAELRRPESLAYNYYTPRFRLLITTRPIEPRLLVEHRAQFLFRDDELQSTARMRYAIERAGIFELRYKIPAGLRIDRVDCEAMKEFQVPEGGDQLVVSLREKTQGPIDITVTGRLDLDPARKDALPLPLLEPQHVARENGAVTVYAPPSLEVITDEKAVRGAQPARTDAVPGEAIPNTRLVSAWTFLRQPVIPVRTERKPTRLTASAATRINIRQELTEVVTLLNYEVTFAGLDTFRFAVPEAVADSVQVETGEAGPPIRQKSRADEATDGWVTWTVVLQREMTGSVPLRVRYDLKPEETDKKKTMTISPLRVVDSPGKGAGAAAVVPAALAGEVIVEKDNALSVTAKADDFEPIDVRELTLFPPVGYLAYRYFKQPQALATAFALELTATRNEIQPVVETVVSKALIEAVVTEDKSVTYRCRYRLRTSERQRLTLELPGDAEILDTLVAGKRVDLEKGDAATTSGRDEFKVNVARVTAVDEPFVLAIVFRLPFKDAPLKGRGGNLKLPLPRLGGAPVAGHSPVALQQLRTAVWVPREFSLVGTPSDFTPGRSTSLTLSRGALGFAASTQELEDWFGDLAGGLFAFTPSGRAYLYNRLGPADDVELSYWRTAWFTWTVSGALLVVALILVRTSWENRLTIVLLVAFAAALYALKDFDLVVNLLGVARFGILATAAYWLIHALTRPRSGTSGITFRPGDPATAVSALGAVIPPPGLFESKSE
jgi:hypothetical protein